MSESGSPHFGDPPRDLFVMIHYLVGDSLIIFFVDPHRTPDVRVHYFSFFQLLRLVLSLFVV